MFIAVRSFLPSLLCILVVSLPLRFIVPLLLLLFLSERVESTYYHSRNLGQCSDHGCTSNKWHSEALSAATLHESEGDILASGGLFQVKTYLLRGIWYPDSLSK